VALFLDFWKLLIASKFPEYAEGIHIVPVLALGSVFLGVYYNLSVWYKLTNKNMTGAYITIGGAVLTIGLNILLIPIFRYTGAAWATFLCYTFMMVISYVLGQKHYPIPYAKKKLLTYIGIVVLMYIFHEVIVRNLTPGTSYFTLIYYSTSLLFIGVFALLILKVEKAEFARMPVIGRYFASST
jgi:O-antigen/teichoic acid export membrane protein